MFYFSIILGKVRLYYDLHPAAGEMKPVGFNICKPTVLKPEQESGSPESSSKSRRPHQPMYLLQDPLVTVCENVLG